MDIIVCSRCSALIAFSPNLHHSSAYPENGELFYCPNCVDISTKKEKVKV